MASERGGSFGDSAEFLSHKVEEFLVWLHSRCSDNDAIGTEVFQLESLKGVGIQVINIGFETVQRHSQAFQTIGGLKDFIRKMFIFI